MAVKLIVFFNLFCENRVSYHSENVVVTVQFSQSLGSFVHIMTDFEINYLANGKSYDQSLYQLSVFGNFRIIIIIVFRSLKAHSLLTDLLQQLIPI